MSEVVKYLKMSIYVNIKQQDIDDEERQRCNINNLMQLTKIMYYANQTNDWNLMQHIKQYIHLVPLPSSYIQK